MAWKIKLIIAAIVTAIMVALGTTVGVMSSRISTLNREVAAATTNIKAFELENSGLKDDAIVFQYTIDQLNNSNDSLVQRMNALRKDLKLKDKNIQRLEYLVSENSKKDSIVFVHDTLFQKDVKIDTTISDEWSKLNLHLEYPNIVATEYSFTNELLISTSIVKETIKPEKKCKLARLFQKKHKVIHVKVDEQNPYCEQKEHKFIEVIH